MHCTGWCVFRAVVQLYLSPAPHDSQYKVLVVVVSQVLGNIFGKKIHFVVKKEMRVNGDV